MGSYNTVTIELSDPEAATRVISFLEDHEEFVSPKQPDADHVVVHARTYLPRERDVIRTLLGLDGVSRVGHMISNDTSDAAHGTVYWLQDGDMHDYEAAADDIDSDDIDDRHGGGTIQKIRSEIGFEIYSWWDYSVDGMEKRYHRYLKEDVTQELVEAGIIDDEDDV